MIQAPLIVIKNWLKIVVCMNVNELSVINLFYIIQFFTKLEIWTMHEKYTFE